MVGHLRNGAAPCLTRPSLIEVKTKTQIFGDQHRVVARIVASCDAGAPKN